MALEGRLGRRADVSSMFGIVQPGSEQARRNLEQQARVARDRTLKDRPVWVPPDPNRKPPAGIVRAR